MLNRLIAASLVLLVFAGCDNNDTGPSSLELVQAFVGTQSLELASGATEGLPVDRSISLVFSSPVQAESVSAVRLLRSQTQVDADVSVGSDPRTVVLHPKAPLEPNTTYTVEISSDLRGSKGAKFVQRSFSFKTAMAPLLIVSAEFGGRIAGSASRVTDVPLDLSLRLEFSAPVDGQSLQQAVTLSGPGTTSLTFSLSEGDRVVQIMSGPLAHLSRFQFRILQALKGVGGEPFEGYSKTLYTAADPTPKFPLISDEELLTVVQQQTFKYFWDFAHPVSGMARERNTSGDVVTSGGSGFGIMCLIVGIERGFISREEGLDRMRKILTFLEGADRFHGAWSHWINGNTGKVIPFSANDNGGDLVETSFLVQGLLAFRQYLNADDATESQLIGRINALWHSVEWDWFTRGEDVLYWHWSPDKQWAMNHKISGYNEALITYLLAASSPDHAISKSAYTKGWADDGGIRTNRTYYGITLPLGFEYGGPLFFAHYSFLGLDPRSLQDEYANYWTQNVNHSRINHAYVVANPKDFVGYSDENWGLTASDNHQGYSAHSPTNDLGVISPTAALSSFPYTPVESMKALKFFYYTLGDRLWGPYGFYDAFNITEGWVADSYLAIDQGPIVVMIENYRTGLLWDLFMSAPEVRTGMDNLGFGN